MANFQSYYGTVTEINEFFLGNKKSDRHKLMLIKTPSGDPINLVITPSTYFVNNAVVREGDKITGFYDADAPTPLIFPPQLQAIAISKNSKNFNVKASYFNEQLISSDGKLKLYIGPYTKIVNSSGQPYRGSIAKHDLIVMYGTSTKGIPAQTTPYKIIVLH